MREGESRGEGKGESFSQIIIYSWSDYMEGPIG